jgi:putative spermidine/putrescine transport system substrate-binding protein
MTAPRRSLRSRRSLKIVGPLMATGLLLAACGGDDATDSAPAATAAPTTAAPATTAAASTDTTAASTDTTAAPAASGGFATMDEIAALCPADIAPEKLVFSTFPGQQTLIDPVTEMFTEATGVDIEWLENNLGDRLTKLAAEKGAPTIDVALVPVGEAPRLLANGVTDPANTELPNYEQLLDFAKLESGYGVSVLQFGIAYNPEFVEKPTSWADLLDETYAGHIALPSMPNSGGYAFLTMLAKNAGGSEADLTAAIDQVAAFKANAHSFIGATPTVEEQIKSGEIRMYVDIGGVAAGAKLKRDVPVEFVVPDEGSPVSINTLVVPAGSKHTGCAEAFVAFMLGEESQKTWAEQLLYGSSSSIIEFDAELASSLYPAPGADNIVEIDWSVISTNGPDTIDYWNRQVTS